MLQLPLVLENRGATLTIKRIPNEVRFWRKVSKAGPDDCWIWTGSTLPFGHGLFGLASATVGGPHQRILAHRFSYILAHGAIPDCLCVLHKCDNPPCVNPKHLFTGTQWDNVQDCVNKGRNSNGTHPGEEYPGHKLTECDVINIRIEYAKGDIFQRDLARFYNVSQPLIGMIIRREAWKHVQ